MMVIGGYRGKGRSDKGVDKADSGWILSLKRIGLYDLITLALIGMHFVE